MYELLQRLYNFPGRFYVVGGYVRDELWAEICKRENTSTDLDFECFEINPENLVIYLEETFGKENVQITGKGFPVYRIKYPGFDIQFALPRWERKVSTGYYGFAHTVDPNMPMFDAAIRRDLTINSIYMNPFTGQIIDPMNGINDLEKKLLRPTSEHFSEDPIRALRVGYFAARFGFDWTQDALIYSRNLRSEFDTIAKEKLYEIFLKTSEKSIKPSLFLEFLRQSGWIEFFGMLEVMPNIQQNPTFHPEGNAWAHTLQVMDKYAEEFGSDSVGFFATMLHDYGKVWATFQKENGNWTAPKHELDSAERCTEVLHDINPLFETGLVDKIRELCLYHMFLNEPPTAKNIRRVASKLKYNSFEDLWKVCVADQLSRVSSAGIRPPDFEQSKRNLDRWKEEFYKVIPKGEKFQRIVTGDDLIKCGILPGKQMGEFLKICERLQVDGVLTADNVSQIVPDVLNGKLS